MRSAPGVRCGASSLDGELVGRGLVAGHVGDLAGSDVGAEQVRALPGHHHPGDAALGVAEQDDLVRAQVAAQILGDLHAVPGHEVEAHLAPSVSP